ncbi:MAG: hypothetical protein A4E61_00299 [Syntrophorhabdus sp. PtaB.Bin184]|nr:MAG: hypothetical protein A4E61_00299 [Syntrophorhabdus sp. PtaB.Bin184]
MTMKTLSGNDRGMSLVVLIVAMTLIAVLGASFVALVASKHKGFQYQRDSYRAINLAHAGIEYASRYVGDGILLTENTSDFLHSPGSYPNVPVTTIVPDTTNLGTTQWKRFDFPDDGGSFYLSYYLNPSDPDNADTNKVLYSVGVSGNAQRTVRLKKFLSYASPSLAGLGKLNIVPGYHPYISGRYVVVPVINMYDSSLTITSLTFELNSTDNNIKHLERIYFNDSSTSVGSSIYQASWYPSVLTDWCLWGSPPCYDYVDDSIRIPDTGVTKTMDLTNSTIGGHYIRWFFFRFGESGTAVLRGTYTITFNYSGGAAVIKFTL